MSPAATPPPAIESAEAPLPPLSVRGLLLGSGPRFARDGFGPLFAFYVGWKAVGLVAGILAATALALASLLWERRQQRTGLMARIGLVLVLLQAAVGLLTGSEVAYLAQPVLVNAAYGTAFLTSAALGRPLIGLFAGELYPMPDEVRRSVTYRQVFGRMSLVWGGYLLARSGVRLAMLTGEGVEAFLVVNLLTGPPLTAGLLSWSVWYGVRSFRRSAEWGPVLAALETEPPRG